MSPTHSTLVASPVLQMSMTYCASVSRCLVVLITGDDLIAVGEHCRLDLAFTFISLIRHCLPTLH
jgi:hypothetical protein